MAAAAPKVPKALTEQEFLELGMEIAGYDRWRFNKEATNFDNFKSDIGVTPLTCSQIWSDLIALDESPITVFSKPMHLLLVCRYLFLYSTEKQLGQFFKIRSEDTVRKHCKEGVEVLQRLLPSKMLSWEDADDGMFFFLSVDGTHCPIEEPRPFSTIWSSHKFGGHAAVNYEIGISISRPKLIWLYGSTQPGAHNDLEVARQELIPALRQYGRGRRAMGDGICAALDVTDVISTKNAYDPREIEEFKDRVGSRHECYNKFLKNFQVLKEKFRHELDTHKAHFEAVNTLACYQLDNGSYNLWDSYPIY